MSELRVVSSFAQLLCILFIRKFDFYKYFCIMTVCRAISNTIIKRKFNNLSVNGNFKWEFLIKPQTKHPHEKPEKSFLCFSLCSTSISLLNISAVLVEKIPLTRYTANFFGVSYKNTWILYFYDFAKLNNRP